MRRLGLACAAGAVVLGLAACGGGGTADQPAVTQTTAPAVSSDGGYGGSGVPYGSAVDSARDTAGDLEDRNDQLEQSTP